MAPVDRAKAIAKTLFVIELGCQHQPAEQQQQDGLGRPALDQLVDHTLGLVVTAQGLLETQQVILMAADKLDDAIIAVAKLIEHLSLLLFTLGRCG